MARETGRRDDARVREAARFGVAAACLQWLASRRAVRVGSPARAALLAVAPRRPVAAHDRGAPFRIAHSATRTAAPAPNSLHAQRLARARCKEPEQRSTHHTPTHTAQCAQHVGASAMPSTVFIASRANHRGASPELQ